MCGGDIELAADKTFGTCEFCGSTMTFPKVDDEQRAAAFNRGNHFRRIGEFDKALAVYERIVREDNTDAEAHWCCALCRFGIEYVEDPTTLEYLPTCHRASFDSFLEDVDYLAAVEYSDGVTKRQYQKDAAKIAEVQRGILATSQNEEPFDVFICYKESDENGERTRDSLMAQDVYYQLTEQGYRVFFARITLEDMAGKQYEPYIFAALNSAKVMVVIGTKPEYMNAVWVKNEWSRFLTMMKKDRHKILLPCYKDMDPYDMPEQLSILQSYDMSKIGFIQDLIRGIKKVLDAEKKPEQAKETVVVQQTAATPTAPLLQRAFMFLEDGEWDSANEYCEKVLDIDPECAQAYLGKLMAERKAKKQESLKDQAEPFSENGNFQKAVRFADEKLKATLEGYIEHIITRNENARLDGIYIQANHKMLQDTENAYREAARIFETISHHKDAATLVQECYEKAEIARKDAIYAQANTQMHGQVASKYESAIRLFESISGWKDADQQIEVCQKKIAEIKAKEEADRLERERKAEIARKAAAERAKKTKIIAIIAAAVAGVVVAFLIVLNTVIIPNGKYNDAVALMNAGKYTEAISAFEALGGYKDSINKIEDCNINIYGEEVWNKIKSVNIGDTYTFGSYEQDNNKSNVQEDIEWLVLSKEGTKILVISKYALDCKPYNTSYTDVTWETCTLRKWLNNDFLSAAFSADEKAMIPTVTVSADKNPEYRTNPGNATQDQVFLLSITEANKYFNSDSARQCKPTVYAVANGAYESNSGNCWWWLRSPGEDQDGAAGVSSLGNVDVNDRHIHNESIAVRPAMWIDFSKIS